MGRTIGDLLAEVPAGQARTFKASHADASEDRFFEVGFAHKYGPPVTWLNRPSFMDLPWMGSRTKPRIGVSGLEDPQFVYDGETQKLVDFYSTGTAAYLISERLLAVIEGIDPDSLEVRPVSVAAVDGSADFSLVMPLRNLSAVDIERTDVAVEDRQLATEWVRSVKFPSAVIFDKAILVDVHNFSDTDVLNFWFWSRDLIDEAKRSGVHGLYTKRPGEVLKQVDEL